MTVTNNKAPFSLSDCFCNACEWLCNLCSTTDDKVEDIRSQVLTGNAHVRLQSTEVISIQRALAERTSYSEQYPGTTLTQEIIDKEF